MEPHIPKAPPTPRRKFVDIAPQFHDMATCHRTLFETIEYMQRIASVHRRTNPRKRSHHAAAVLVGGTLVQSSIAINNGHIHAETSAWERFTASGHGCVIKRGYYHHSSASDRVSRSTMRI